MIRTLTLSLSLLILSIFTASSQIISVNPVKPGPYGAGSSIAVSIKIQDNAAKLKADNVFKLFVSDASGSFAAEKEIGSYPGFYTTFINGVIPTGLPAGNYKVRVKNSSNTTVSLPSNSFEIQAQTGVVADIDASAAQTLGNNPETFGVCSPEKTTNFRFTNSSTANANVAVSFTNELNTSDVKQFTIDGSPLNFMAEMSHYTIFVEATLNGTTGTKAYFLINNVIKPGFNSPANNTVCLPAVLQYDIETSSSNGIQNNFPGYSYQINWGDGIIENVTPNQIYLAGGVVRHTYTRSSCGKQIKINDVNYYNVFGIIYQVSSPFCGLVSVPLSTQAKVITQPENKFGLPAAVCINTDVIINNASIAGDNPSSNSPECKNNTNVYYWYIDGVPVTPQGVPITYALNYKFLAPGFHTVRLESESNSNCEAAPLEKTVYVQAAPIPNFSLSETLSCAGTIIKTTDLSVVDVGAQAQNSYLWNVRGPSAVTYANGTSSVSKSPEFQFQAAGTYIVQLTITSPCGAITSEQTVVINSTPKINANWQSNLCGKGQLLSFNNTTGNSVNTSFSGTSEIKSDTYTWTVTGGAYSFRNNTNANSKEPSIFFEDYGTYTISVTHQNNCGTETVTKTITFNESPTVSAGLDQEICAGSPVTLNGTITGGTALSYKWVGGNGTFSPSRNSLTPTYIPTAQEIAAGEVSLILSIVTTNPSPCNTVEDVVIIKINSVNNITSAGTKAICTNTAINYLPTASLPETTFSWTATGSENAAGYSTVGTGEIKDVVSNTDPSREATITYTIIPTNNGCAGEPFTLVITITGIPKVTATALNSTICSGKESKISLVSNFPGMRYTWTSTVTGNITGNRNQTTPVAIDEIIETFSNSGTTNGTVKYTIIPENTTGCSGEAITITVNVSTSPGISTFSPNKTTGCSPLAITFNNSTPGIANTYRWDFGDGQTLVTTDNKAVNHIYTSAVARTYKVSLITETDCGSFSSEYTIKISPNTVLPQFIVNGDQYEGCAPHKVNFVNNSTGAVLFKYDFGDGTVIETNRSPENVEHVFTKSGTYNVKFTASNGCSDTTITQTIKVFPQAVTDFTADFTESCATVTAKFQNKSTDALSYLWDFGDGTVSTEVNPVHTFSHNKKAYTIRLISTSSLGCTDTLELLDYIKVIAAPVADFKVLPGETIQHPNYNFSFTDKTIGEVESLKWDFGDGSTSTLPNPEHSYADTGSYKVTLTAVNSLGCTSTQVKTVRIIGTPGNLFIPNAFMPNSLTNEIRTFIPKGSGIETWNMRIFNKWGEMIWETNKLDDKGSPVEGWDGNMHGTPASQGIYFWEISARFINGTEWAGMIYNNSEPKKTGTINLIR